MNTRTILFCDNSLRELLNFRGEVINYFASSGYKVILVAPKNVEAINLASNVRFFPVRLERSGKNPISELKYLKTLRSIYKKEKPDYIFHYTIKPNIYGTLAAKWCGIPSTVMIAGLGYVFNGAGLGNFIARSLYKFALRFTDKVFVLNAGNEKLLREKNMVPADKVILLRGGEGIDLERFIPKTLPENKENTTFLMIGRLLYDKGYEEYVKAAATVKKQYPDAEFQLLGDFDFSYPDHVTKERVERDCSREIIHYLGYSPEVATKIQMADCIVLPSYHEGLSRVLIEALAMGKPIITTDIPGCRETVEHGKNGFLVAPKDIESLAAAFTQFVHTGAREREEMGKYSRKKAEEEFNIKHVISEYKKIIDTVESTDKVFRKFHEYEYKI